MALTIHKSRPGEGSEDWSKDIPRNHVANAIIGYKRGLESGEVVSARSRGRGKEWSVVLEVPRAAEGGERHGRRNFWAGNVQKSSHQQYAETIVARCRRSHVVGREGSNRVGES